MANTLGALVVRLGLDAAEFTSGLTKSEYDAQKLAKALDERIAKAANLAAVAIAGIGAAAGAAYLAMDHLVKQAGEFQDRAEKMGDAADAIASFAVAAGITNTSMDALVGASVKLTKNLTGVDDESKAAGAAIAALGLNLKDFKTLSPAEQIDAVAKAMAGFTDDAGKTAVAVALFGKAGAEMLPFLKELGSGVGRVNILTREQILLADEYADRQAKSRTELNLYAQALATQALPAVTAFTGALTDVIKGLLGVDKASGDIRNSKAILDFSEGGALALATMADKAFTLGAYVYGLARNFGGAAAAINESLKGNFDRAGKIVDAIREDNRAMKTQLGLADATAARFKQMRADAANFDNEARRRAGHGVQASISFNGGAKTDKNAADRTSEAEKYLDRLTKQLEKTEELTFVEQALREIQKGRLAGLTPQIEQQILATARLLDLHKAEVDNLKEQEEAAKKAAQAAGEMFRQAEQFALAVETPSEKLTRQMEALNRAVEENPLISDETAARNAQKYWDDFIKTVEVAVHVISEAEAFSKRAAENIQDFLGNSLYDVLSGNFKDIGKSFTNMINRMIAEATSAQISRYLFGDLVKGGEGSGVAGGFLSSFISGLFGGGGSSSSGMPDSVPTRGGRAIGGPVLPGGMYPVNERGPELLDVNGRQFLMMGNQRGQVTPMSSASGGDTIIFNVTVPAGTPNATAEHIAAEANRRLANRRNL